MKKLLCCLLIMSPSLLWADEASHKAAASEFLKVNGSEESMKTAFATVMEGNYEGMAAQGVPAPAIAEVKTAVDKWYSDTVKWEVIEPKMAELYVKEFTEEELKQLIEFYKTPLGEKVRNRIPELMKAGGKLGQEMVEANQEVISQQIGDIMEKYRPQPGGGPGGTVSPAVPGAPDAPAAE